MYKPEYVCDLHTHTLRSDGNDTPRELIDKAVDIGMRAIVLCDHDIVPPQVIDVDGTEVNPVEYAMSKGLIFIPGIEYSCDTINEDVHIVGIGCDYNSKPIIDAEEAAIKSKINGYRKLTEVLCREGIMVTWDDILSGGNEIRKPENVQRKHIFEEIAKKGYAHTWSEAKLMVRNNPKFSIKREKIDPKAAIKCIKESGGYAILAHPYLIDEQLKYNGIKMTRCEYIKMLIESGIDGIEAYYTYAKTSYSGNMTQNDIEQEIRTRYEGVVSIISGGSDYHNDGKKGLQNPRMIGEAGVTWEYFRQNKLLSTFIK